MRAEEIEATVRRFIESEDGIIPALRLIDAADVDEGLAARLRKLVERRRIRFLAEAAVDGQTVDTTGMSYEDVLASLRDLVGESGDPKLKRMADGVAAIFGDKQAAERMKTGSARAKRKGDVVVAPSGGEDLGLAVATDGEALKPVWLDDGEFIFSNQAIDGLGIRAGASKEEVRNVGLAELEKLHNELKTLAAPEQPPPKVVPVAENKRPGETLVEAQMLEERRERSAVTDDKGRWHATDELIEAVIEAESSGRAEAVSPTGAIGLMQVLPSTAADPGYGVEGLSGSREEIVQQLLDPKINKALGTAYLDAMLNRFGGDVELALAAYNQGAGKVAHVEGEERPLEKFATLYEEEAREALPYVEKILAGV